MKKSSLTVKPGQKVRLKNFDPSYTDGHSSHEDAIPKIREYVAHMSRLQYLLYADNDQSLLVVLQAMDAAGKDGVIRHLFSGMNAQGTFVSAFKQPSHEEAAHDFLWRAHKRVPSRGEIAIFNRSYYEDVLVVRVHDLEKKAVWSKRYDQINDFEKMLSRNRTKILKFYLHISPEEQLARFKQRLEDPARNWKISDGDYSERELWPKYVKAYEDVLDRTSTEVAPWHIIPANHKWFRDLAVSKIIAGALEEMDLKLPPVRVNMKDILVKYHEAERETIGRSKAAKRRHLTS